MKAPTCITIGNFDGVHLGHRALLNLAAQIGRQNQLSFQILTFWPHPRIVIKGKESHKPLTSRQDRLALLANSGPARIQELPFTQELASLSAEEFVRNFLLPLGIKELVIGHDFTLGHLREGNAKLLEEIGNKYGFGVTQATAFTIDDEPVSSTRLRKCIANGDVSLATRMLGRPYAISGKIEHGFGRGADLGFPTANLGQIDELLPANGVYATNARIGGKRYCAVTNIGYNPTFGNSRQSVETFLLNCHGDLYGENLSLDFIARLRDERKFDSPADLVQQINYDIAQAKGILSCQDI